MRAGAASLSPVVIIHQEGVVGLLALIGLAMGDQGAMAALASVHPVPVSIGYGAAAGLVLSGLLWLLRFYRPLRELETWQRRFISGWTVSDAVAVALLSGVAEEALIRACLQPLIGLWPAALVFALLHLVPDSRLWLWPVVAMVIGLVFGVLFEYSGYPACAAGHVALNLVALLRLRRVEP